MPNSKTKHRGRNKTVYYRKREHTLDPDQINERLTPEHIQALQSRKPDVFLPGEGKFYCLVCDKHFVDENAQKSHERGGQHRHRLREVREGGFNPKMALQAAGIGVDNGKKL